MPAVRGQRRAAFIVPVARCPREQAGESQTLNLLSNWLEFPMAPLLCLVFLQSQPEAEESEVPSLSVDSE